MSKIYSAHLHDFSVHLSERLFNDDRMIFKDIASRSDTTLYMICKTKMLRWLPRTASFDCQYRLHSDVLHGDKIFKNLVVDLVDFWWDMPYIQQSGLTKDEFSDQVLGRMTTNLKYVFPKRILYKLNSYIKTKMPSSELMIDCAMKRHFTKEHDGKTSLSIYQMCQWLTWNIDLEIEILYVGISGKDTFHRLSNHNKWGEILTAKDNEEDILVYQFDILDDQLNINKTHDNMVVFRVPSEFDRIKKMKIVEAFLINYFKPKHNDVYKNSTLEQTQIIDLLTNNSYHEVHIEVKLPGPMGKLGTKMVGFGDHDVRLTIKKS